MAAQPLMILSLLAAGLLVGSFAATVALRLPRHESPLGGRSRCDGCGRTLTPSELIPIVSAVRLGGRCRTCGVPIARIHGLMELGCAAIGAIAAALLPPGPALLGALLGWTLLTLSVIDAGHRWLPRAIVIPLGLAGLAVSVAGWGVPLRDAVAGAVLGFASLWLVGWSYRRLRGREGLGGGDPKLFGALGAWLGWQPLPAVLLAAAVLGLLWAMARGLRATDSLPFGPCLAAAGWVAWMLIA